MKPGLSPKGTTGWIIAIGLTIGNYMSTWNGATDQPSPAPSYPFLIMKASSAIEFERSCYLTVLQIEEAGKRACLHQQFGRKEIIIAQIESKFLKPTFISLKVSDQEIALPVWSSTGGTMFISTVDARRHLGVQLSTSQKSEWFAVDHIPAEMIVRIMEFN